jgi:hypothetical protein
MVAETRCPFCIAAGFDFRVMVRNIHDQYVCPSCGHVKYPERCGLTCDCARCQRREGYLRDGTVARSHDMKVSREISGR